MTPLIFFQNFLSTIPLKSQFKYNLFFNFVITEKWKLNMWKEVKVLSTISAQNICTTAGGFVIILNHRCTFWQSKVERFLNTFHLPYQVTHLFVISFNCTVKPFNKIVSKWNNDIIIIKQMTYLSQFAFYKRYINYYQQVKFYEGRSL